MAVSSAFLLHARPFREQQWLLSLLTADQGRLTAIGRGDKPDCYRQLNLRLSGQSELKRLDSWSYEAPIWLRQGKALLAGFYLNELLVRLWSHYQPDSVLFGLYSSTLLALAQPRGHEEALRYFELTLLQQLGFGIDLKRSADENLPIKAQQRYRFQRDLGFCQLGQNRRVLGQTILDVSRNDWHKKSLQLAKDICQARITDLLPTPLISQSWLEDS